MNIDISSSEGLLVEFWLPVMVTIEPLQVCMSGKH